MPNWKWKSDQITPFRESFIELIIGFLIYGVILLK